MSTLIVVDPREIFRAGLRQLLREAGHNVVADCCQALDIAALAARHQPDIVIARVNLAEPDAAGLSRQVKAASGGTRNIFILQPGGRLDLSNIQELDAEGLLLDDVSRDHLLECVDAVGAGKKWSDPNILQLLMAPALQQGQHGKLTGRETEVAVLVSRGLRTKTIARQLNVSEGTVKTHLHHVFEKLALGSRAELAAWATVGIHGEPQRH